MGLLVCLIFSIYYPIENKMFDNIYDHVIKVIALIFESFKSI